MAFRGNKNYDAPPHNEEKYFTPPGLVNTQKINFW